VALLSSIGSCVLEWHVLITALAGTHFASKLADS